MKFPRLDGHVYFLFSGSISAAYWLIASIAGHKPDGGLLGFSAGMFAVWSAMRKDGERRDENDEEEEEDHHNKEEDDEDPIAEDRRRNGKRPQQKRRKR